ncbi:PEGA domain-containing protein [Methanocalculus chunghsingensis]|nr:PEGA domain-containing protein [Methanocalculus chunghsingensis]
MIKYTYDGILFDDMLFLEVSASNRLAIIPRLLIAILLLFCIIQVATAAPILVAASDSSATTRSSAHYLCNGVNDHLTIQAALNAVPATGGDVLLLAGTYNCGGPISPKKSTIMHGEGDKKTFIKFLRNDGYINLVNEYVTLKDFNVEGKNYNYPYKGVITVRVGNVRLQNIIGTADSSIEGVFYVHGGSLPGYNKNIQNIEFNNCKVLKAGTHGFVLNAGRSYPDIINARFIDCVANNCGLESRFNSWVTGFLFAEYNNLIDFVAINCSAEGNWESGFHVENPGVKQNGVFYPVKKTNVSYINCVSKNNAQKSKLSDEKTLFGAGFMVNGDMHLINCISENNRYGFLTYGGGFQIEKSQDTNSWMGIALPRPGDPAGTRISETRLINQVYPIHFSNGESKNVVIENVYISSGGESRSSPAITINSGIINPSNILVKDSIIEGYYYGVSNANPNSKVRISDVGVNKASTNFVNCQVLSASTPPLSSIPITPIPTTPVPTTPVPTTPVPTTPVPTTPVPTTPVPTTPVPIGTVDVRFTSNPTDANIYIDGTLRGRTPLTVSGITLGEHEIELRKSGYQTWVKEIDVTEAALRTTWSYNPQLVKA